MSVEDRLAIQDLNYAYAYHIDLFEIDAWVDLFASDAYFDESDFGFGLHEGHDAIRAYGHHLKDITVHAVHLMSNHLVRDLTPTMATGTAFGLIEVLMKTGERMRYQVMYIDDYVKVEGHWKIARRVLRKTFPVENVPTADT